ncbi:MAG: hypothetical protein A4E69_00213 [Syntrophus sp. PtaB.Bin138]|nr:MAG: hypothetical protein A4E69_00213 [Syntrophus sp. PtaB.Bin138]
MAFTAPQEAPVVTAAKRAELKIPKRTSLPSMLPPAGSTPREIRWGFPAVSACQQIRMPARSRIAMALQIAQPCRWLFTLRPRYQVRPLGISRMESIWMKFASGVGFS